MRKGYKPLCFLPPSPRRKGRGGAFKLSLPTRTHMLTDAIAIDITTTKASRLAEVDFTDLKFGKTFADHMFVADYRDGRWQDFRIEPYADLQLSPATSALHYGQSIFEGLKAYRLDDGQVVIFRPDKNAARMAASAERMCIPPVPEDLFFAGLSQLVQLDQDWVPTQHGSSLYLRPFVFATDGFVGIRASETYRFIIFSCPVGIYYSEPVRVKIERHYSRAMPGGTGAAKCAGNYAGALYPTKLAQLTGFHQLIWTDSNEHRYVEESGTMNVMFIINGRLITPPLSDTILNGVTRDTVLTLAREQGLPVEERKISVDEIVTALEQGTIQDAFGVGTAATFAPMQLISIDGVDYPLPPASAHSKRLRQTLEDIRTGAVEDTHGWLYRLA